MMSRPWPMDRDVTCDLCGAFKPPHGGHLYPSDDFGDLCQDCKDAGGL